MPRLKYFPFGEQFDLRMGTVVFSETDQLIDADEPHYSTEIKAKRILLEQDHNYYFRSNAAAALAQWDVLDKVLHDLTLFSPSLFTLEKNGDRWKWINHILKEELSFTFQDPSTLPLQPLDWAGRQVQEDLIILSNDGSATLTAGQLCFANGWSLNDKFNQSFLHIHQPAPAMVAPTMQTAQKLMERILATRPVWRCSWNFKISGQLDLSSRYNKAYNENLQAVAPNLTAENIGDQLFIRIERQTISRLQRSGCILFGIHMYQNTLNEEDMTKAQARNMLGVLETTPREMLDYKAITPVETALKDYLRNIINR